MFLKQREQIKAARKLFSEIVEARGLDLDKDTLQSLLVKAYLKGRIEATKLAKDEYETDTEE